MRENILKKKSYRFGVDILELYRCLLDGKDRNLKAFEQLQKSGTAVGALVREGEFAESPADFIHKYGIAQKECNEAIYWLEILHDTRYLSDNQFSQLHSDAVELMKIITASIKTAKANLELKKAESQRKQLNNN